MSWLAGHPEISTVRTAVADLNGQARGKRIAARFADKVETVGIRMPLSALNLDIMGEDIVDSPLVFASGDGDGVMRPTGRGYVPMPWLNTPSALMPLWAFHDDGAPFKGDPRHALSSVLDRFAAQGWTPVVATELEFYLFENSATLIPPVSPDNGQRRTGADILDLLVLDGFDAFFTDLYDACAAMDIPADAVISEAGPGQFEVNLMHQPDALKAADDVWLFKMLIKGMARKHHMAASFMAKPYPDCSGNGLHTHFSILDTAGTNIFSDGDEYLHHAIAGCLSAMHDSTLIFAPYANSYDRFARETHAPTHICWGHENRTAALRIPGGDLKNRRIEHRVAGGDSNPYLMLASILGAALIGLEDRIAPPAPVVGNAAAQNHARLARSWAAAIDAVEASKTLSRVLPSELIANLLMTKRQEAATFASMSKEEITRLTLDSV